MPGGWGGTLRTDKISQSEHTHWGKLTVGIVKTE